MAASRCLIKTASASERLTGSELVQQAISRRSREDADLRTAILDPAAAGDVYGTHRPLPPVVPMSPDYQFDFHSSSGA